ncbi:DNA cytosine methyltransferase [Deinococcus sp. 6YEL10]|uniref:DNA cytosine methyltransferase n=1 Tax=Deinococcus sp. 6YEL10 TaxID=2745870 RepID=UPI001E4715AA|nr:DNA cytosine methyltransferase [Deinococcus sp. 6YEL10]MCD0159819.1 DNA cytosine methyltransferase [Deinococcus sp. 6YEL10]
MRAISLCTGVGGFDLAFLNAGFQITGMVEWDTPAQAVLKHHFPDTPLESDVKTLHGMHFGPAEVIMGGFPCQDLSTAGRRAGLQGERSGLFFHFMRIVKEMRHATANEYPHFLVLENVPGLLTSGKGGDFQLLLDELADSGAVEIAWRVVDSRSTGIPQRRRRVVIVADYRGERAGSVLSLGESLPGRPGQSGA